jgi:hypothetical protein
MCFQFLPEFDLIFKGSDALERKGVYYSISNQDHPVTKLLQSPLKAQRTANVLISLSTKQVSSYYLPISIESTKN